MSKLPRWLHPATLRWLAYDQVDEAERQEDAAHGLATIGHGDVADHWRGRAREHRMTAKRLRGIATRIERRSPR